MSDAGYQGLPDVTLGMGEDGDEVKLLSDHRANGTLIIGRSGAGKSWVADNVMLQDANALDDKGEPLCGVLYFDAHDGTRHVLPRIRQERRKDTYVISLLPEDDIPLLALLGEMIDPDSVQNLASLLVDAWRVQYGTTSVGTRAEDTLSYALRTAPRTNVSPMELKAIMSLVGYRRSEIAKRDLNGDDFDLYMYWYGDILAVGERTYAEWSYSVKNKVSPLLHNQWLRLATCGTPPVEEADVQSCDVLDAKDVISVMLLGDGLLIVERDSVRNRGGAPARIPVRFDHQFDDYLVDHVAGDVVHCRAFPEGKTVSDPASFCNDAHEPGLRFPSDEELSQWGPALGTHVSRRRRRRAFLRYAALVLADRESFRDSHNVERRLVVRQVISIADLLDDRKIVVVEIPQFRGPQTTRIIATFTLIQALMRGYRQLALPPDRIVPVSMVGDEASIYMSATLEQTFAQLRKAKVSLTIATQRLGQLGDASPNLRRGITDTVGSIVSLAPGGREDQDMSREIHVDPEELRSLATGEGYVRTLMTDAGRLNVQAKSRKLKFADLPPVTDDGSAAIRARSIAEIYVPRAEALASVQERIALIRAGQRAHQAKRTDRHAQGVADVVGRGRTPKQANQTANQDPDEWQELLDGLPDAPDSSPSE